MLRTVLLSAVASICLSGVSMAAEYFVSAGGADENAGSREAPWRTLAKANATLAPGDRVTLLDGTHDGIIEPGQSGEPGRPITYRAENPLMAVITGGPASDGDRTCVRLKDRSHIIVDGLYMLPTARGWMKLDRANNCVIRNCRMENAIGHYSPITCTDCHYNRYEHLECWRSNCIGADGHVGGDMWNNYNVSHCVFDRVHISRAGHRPFGLWFDCPNNVVRRCIFDCRWGRNFEFFSTPRLLVEDCVITNGFDGSGSADGRAKLFIIDSIFRRNVVYRNYYGPMVINAYKYEDLPTFGMMRSRLYNNTWARNHEYGYEMVDLNQKPDPHMVHGNVFQNNIFAFNDPGGDGLALYLVSNIAEDNRFLHNLLYGDKPGCKTVRYDWAWPAHNRWDGLRMTAEEANEIKPGQFAGNIDADPLFADMEVDDYRLSTRSPAIDAGAPLAKTTASGSGRMVAVDDARWFYDGFGIPGEVGDMVFVGAGKTAAVVVKADIEANMLTLDRDLAWQQGDAVTVAYNGSAPDLGAYETGAEHQDWYRAPVIPPNLRVETMETATEPVVVTDFEVDNQEEWHYYWNFSRQRATVTKLETQTAASGRRSMRVEATGDGATLSCDIKPRWWDIDRFPTVRVAYRIPPGVPVGMWVHPFKAAAWGTGQVCVAASPALNPGAAPVLPGKVLLDDDQWHEVELDARAIRQVYPDVRLLQMFRFWTNANGKQGQQFWFDNFRILPAGDGG